MGCGARTARSTATVSRCWARTRSSTRSPTNGPRREHGRGWGCSSIALPGCLIGQAAGGAMSPHAFSWIVGADIGWNPVTNLNFDFELMYQSTVQAAPSGFLGTVYNLGGASGAFFQPGGWKGVSDGFAGRLRITRYF